MRHLTTNQTRENAGNNRVKQVLRILVALWVLWLISAATAFAQAPTIYLGDDPNNSPVCNCLDNATMNANGQFATQITVDSDPGENWVVTNSNDLYTPTSPPPPAAPSVITNGTALTETSPGIYELDAIHVDGMEFTVFVSNGATTLNISNNCFYPRPVINGLDDMYCTGSLPVTLDGEDQLGTAGTGSFTINGDPATVFDPAALGVGLHTVVFSFDAGVATPNDPDDPGCIATVTQVVEVLETPDGLGANPTINISLGPDCSFLITPDLILEGSFPCIDTDYTVTAFDAQGMPIGNMVGPDQVNQTVPVLVESVLPGGPSIVGSVFVEDEADPMITCPDDTNMGMIENDIQFIGGVLTASSPTFIPANFSCFDNLVGNTPGLHRYTLQEVMVTEADIYTFELNFDGGQGAAALYIGTVIPAFGACQDLVATSYPLQPGEGYFTNETDVVRISVYLVPGTTYSLLTTSAEPQTEGIFQYAAYSAEEGLIDGIIIGDMEPLTALLLCNDESDVFQNPESVSMVGEPILDDNCTANLEYTFNDELVDNGPCGPVVIERTFTLEDGSGNTDECTQLITIEKANVNDVMMPPLTFSLTCTDPFEFDENGNPHPSVTGYPFVQTAYGIFNLDPLYCNLAASYTDLPSATICDGTYQFVRRWFVIDDCDPTQGRTIDQLIRVGDFSAPLVSCPVDQDVPLGTSDTIFYGTDPFDCTATIDVPLPTVSDNCSSFEVTTEIITLVPELVTNPVGQVIDTIYNEQVIATIGNDDFSRIVPNLPFGCHTFRYYVVDDCGNDATADCVFCIEDRNSPSPACDDALNVTLNNQGLASLHWSDINEGSTDNCGIATYEVRRNLDYLPGSCEEVVPGFTPWGETVEFSCCDIGQTVNVELRVTDNYGNSEICWTSIFVEDKVNPYCWAPHDVEILCTELPHDFEPDSIAHLTFFGDAMGEDNCTANIVTEFAPVVNIDQCGYGTIVRSFQVADGFGNQSTNSCQQTITINASYAFDVFFPADEAISCGTPTPDTHELIEGNCSCVTVQVEDAQFGNADEGCYKILRTFTVTNHCIWDGVTPPVVIHRDEDCDDDLGDEGVWLLVRPEGVFTDRDQYPDNVVPAIGERGTSCDGNSNPDGYWRTLAEAGSYTYRQIITVMDNEAPVVNVSTPEPFCANNPNQCAGEVSINFSLEETCLQIQQLNGAASNLDLQVWADIIVDGNLDVNVTADMLSGNYPNYNVTGNFPIGNHAIQIRATDACGNEEAQWVSFSVVDCAAPEIICLSGVSMELSALNPPADADGDGDIDLAASEIWATDFIASPTEDCSGEVKYSVHAIDAILDGSDVPTSDQSVISFTCDHVGVIPVRVYVWDTASNPYSVQPDGTIGGPNYSFCETFIQVQDLGNVCNPTQTNTVAGLAGLVYTEEDATVEGVALEIMEMSEMQMTPGSGSYEFDGLEVGNSYTLTPEYDADHSNGISTFDLILISKHILGLQQLDSPYKLIAADVNGSGSVTTIDLIQLRKIILGTADDFTNNTSWRFVCADYEFPDPTNPWYENFPEVMYVSSLPEDGIFDANFIAIKVGDVNLNASTSLLQIDPRSHDGHLELTTPSLELSADTEYELPFYANQLADIEGFQFTLLADEELELLEVVPALLSAEDFGKHALNRGILTTSWSLDNGQVIDGNELLFTLRVKSAADVSLEDVLQISSRVTAAEAYAKNASDGNYYGLWNIGLAFTTESADTPITQEESEAGYLGQNEPNPWNNETKIPFELPWACQVRITVYDANGRRVYYHEKAYGAGYHSLIIRKSDIMATGLLYYELNTPLFTETKKMIVNGQ